MQLEPIGEPTVEKPYSIVNLPPLIIGGAVFNTQYENDPEQLPVVDILNAAFGSGLNAIDTSPYYGPSEQILGGALQKVDYKRDQYYICTKAGRIGGDEFDYRPESVRASVMRSLERLHTDYLDLVYMHDIEFVEEEDIYAALAELKKLKDEGHIRNFGASGYPIGFLFKVTKTASTRPEIGPLDAVMLYSNGCLQNTRLFETYEKWFSECGVKKVMNGSILSMSMLRNGPTHKFHPAPDSLKTAVDAVAKWVVDEKDAELADIATRFALRKWLFETIEQSPDLELEWNKKTSIVLGVTLIEQLQDAIEGYWKVKCNKGNVNVNDEETFVRAKEILGDHFDEVWPSGIKGQERMNITI